MIDVEQVLHKPVVRKGGCTWAKRPDLAVEAGRKGGLKNKGKKHPNRKQPEKRR